MFSMLGVCSNKYVFKKWDAFGLNDDDLRLLELDLLEQGDKHPVIKGTGGLRKWRIKISNNKGKSLGVRVCYVNFLKLEIIYLITVYSKNEKDDITENEKKDFKQLIKLLEKALEKSKDEQIGKWNQKRS